MEQSLSTRIEELNKAKESDNYHLANFLKANEEYEKLVREGLAKKRGYNLMTTDEIYNPNLNSVFLKNQLKTT